MLKLNRTLDVYLTYFSQFLKTRLSYRADFISSLIGNVLVTFTGLLFVVFLVDGSTITSLRGWSRTEVLFIYGYSMIAMALFSMVAPNLYGFSDRYIIQGQFDRVLLRPLPTLFQVIFESFNFDGLGSLLVGLYVFSHSAHRLGLSLTALDFVWLLLSAAAGAVILLSVFVVLASMSFHFEDRLGISPPFYNLIQFGRYPVTIYNRTVQFLLRWVVPFAFVAFYPATHFLARREFALFCYMTPLVALAAAAVAGLSWRFGVSRYKSTGN